MNKKNHTRSTRAFDKKIESKNNKKSQTQRMKEEIGKMEELEDTTKYGEFMSSYFSWMTLEGQKDKAKKLENKTKNNE